MLRMNYSDTQAGLKGGSQRVFRFCYIGMQLIEKSSLLAQYFSRVSRLA